MRLYFPKTCVAFLALCSGAIRTSAQSPQQEAIYNVFDGNVGGNNLGINNGTVHFNKFRVANKSFRYLLDDYAKGSIFFDGQYYPNVELKYDLYQDVVIVKVAGENNMLGINLTAEKTAYFTLDDKKFVNLQNTAVGVPQDFKGYYEETEYPNRFTLYTKHRKDRVETTEIDGIFSRYENAENFLLLYQNRWYEVRSESSVRAIFPQFAAQLSQFYTSNAASRNNAPKQFLKDLMAHLDFLLQNSN